MAGSAGSSSSRTRKKRKPGHRNESRRPLVAFAKGRRCPIHANHARRATGRDLASEELRAQLILEILKLPNQGRSPRIVQFSKQRNRVGTRFKQALGARARQPRF